MVIKKALFTLIGLVLFSLSYANVEVIDSKQQRISVPENKWVVVNFWADWCEPCLREMPALNNFYHRHQNEIIVLGVNYDRLPDKKINQFGNRLRISFPLLRDFPKKYFGIGDISTLPMTFIISPQGQVVAQLDGPQTASDILATINRYK